MRRNDRDLEQIIQAQASSLGYLEQGEYQAEPDCQAGVHELIRFLHNDSDTLNARRICLVRNLVKHDLVPILTSPATDEELFCLALRLTAILCQPTVDAFGGKVPEAEDLMQAYYEVEAHLIKSLAAFTSTNIFEKFERILHKHFSKEWTDRIESDSTTCNRIIMLLRYVFSIGMEGPICTEMPTVSSDLKERVVRAFLSTDLPKTLMLVGCDSRERELSVHIMAIFSLACRTVECEKVATVHTQHAEALKKREEEELRAIVEREKNILATKRYESTGHTFLRGQYGVKNAALDPINDLCIEKRDIRTPLDVLRKRKKPKKQAMRFRVRNLMESAFKPSWSSPEDVCMLLNSFCTELVQTTFEKLMRATRSVAFNNVGHQSNINVYSDINYFFLCEYVLAFIRMSNLSIKHAPSVFSKEFFNHVVVQTDTYFETMTTDKHNVRKYAVRAQHAISAYKEMMHLLVALSKAENEDDKETFGYLSQAIYYQQEYREFGYTTLNRLQPHGMTRRLLDDLIVANHFYVLTMERLIKTGELLKVVRKRRLAKRRKSKAKQAKRMLEEVDERARTDHMETDDLEPLWQHIAEGVERVLKGEEKPNEEISPMNFLLKATDEEYQAYAVLQIQRAMRGQRLCDAVGLLRAARDVYPDAAFGEAGAADDAELAALKDIFMLSITDIGKKYDQAMRDVYGKEVAEYDAQKMEEEITSVSDEERKKAAAEDKIASDSEEEESRPKYEVAEIDFDFAAYINNYARPDIINWYIMSLKDYDVNSTEVNKAALKMLHRFAFQLETPSKLYQASLFRIFFRLSEELSKLSKESLKAHRHFALYEFGFHILRKFFSHYKERGDILACEILFTKTKGTCIGIEHGYNAEPPAVVET